MDKKSKWIQWITGGITVLTGLIGLAALIQGNYYRGITLIGGVVVTVSIGICIYIAFSKKAQHKKKRFTYRFNTSNRHASFLAIGLVIGFVLLALLLEPSRSFVVTGLTGRTPPAFSPAGTDETLIVVADFDNRSGGKVGVDPAQRIYNTISEKLSRQDTHIRLEQYHQPVKDSSEAQQILSLYRARIFIWGWYDQIGAQPTIELDTDKIPVSPAGNSCESKVSPPEFNITSPETFASTFTKDIPANSTYIALISLGIMKYTSNDINSSIVFFSQAVDVAISSPLNATDIVSALKWRILGYEFDNQQELVIDDYTKIIDVAPKYICAYNNRGTVYAAQQKYDHALADYNKSIELDPKFKGAYNNRGIVYRSQQKYDLALADYNKSIELDPKFKEAYNNRGVVYRSQQKYDLALADFNKALELDPQYARAYCGLGITHTQLNNFSVAVASMEKGLRLDASLDYCKTALDNARKGIPTP